MTAEKISTTKRLASMLIDHIFMSLVGVIFTLPLMVYVFTDPFNKNIFRSTTYNNLMYLPMFAFSLYLCKDCFNGQSFAKRKLNLQVVDNLTGEIASPIKCFIRDTFCLIFPIEIIVSLNNPSRRIGDIVAGTKLVTKNINARINYKFYYGQIILCVIVSFAFYVLLYRLIALK